MATSLVDDRRTLEFLFPRIYVALPNVGEADMTLSHDDSPVESKLAADLVVFYAYDLVDHFEIISNRELKKFGMTVPELHEIAIHNLDELNLEIRAHGNGKMRMLTAGGNFEAAMLLLPHVWDSVSSMVNGRIVAVVPARDLIFFTGDADPAGLSEMRKQTSQMLELADKPLSRSFLVRVGGGWIPYQGPAD
jgi:uncharacterized protein YtpQ (UPF0354 family)